MAVSVGVWEIVSEQVEVGVAVSVRVSIATSGPTGGAVADGDAAPVASPILAAGVSVSRSIVISSMMTSPVGVGASVGDSSGVGEDKGGAARLREVFVSDGAGANLACGDAPDSDPIKGGSEESAEVGEATTKASGMINSVEVG